MDSAVQSTTEGRAAATAGRVRFAGLACLAGGALELVSVPFGFPLDELSWLLAQLGLMGGLLGMLWLRVAGSGWGGELVLVVPLVGMLLQIGGEAYKIYVIASGSPETDQASLAIIGIGTQLVAVGMILVGIAALRQRAWRGWRSFMPLLVGLYIYLVLFPSLIITGNPPENLVGFWGVSWMLLGYAILSNAPAPRLVAKPERRSPIGASK